YAVGRLVAWRQLEFRALGWTARRSAGDPQILSIGTDRWLRMGRRLRASGDADVRRPHLGAVSKSVVPECNPDLQEVVCDRHAGGRAMVSGVVVLVQRPPGDWPRHWNQRRRDCQVGTTRR